MIIGYARVSTADQSTAAQFPELREAGCVYIYEESQSGKDLKRPELEKCLGSLKKGDTLIVWRLDRLGRSIRDLLKIIDRLNVAQVTFISLKEKFDTSTPSGRLIFHFFAAITEFERDLIREQTLLGLQAARSRGRVGGRKKKLNAQQVRFVKTMWDSEKYSKREIGEQYGVSVSTIDRIVRPEPIGAKAPVTAPKKLSKPKTKTKAGK